MEKCDSRFMLEALALAKMGWGLTNPNPMVGAVIVRDGVVIGQGFHRKAGEAHAEVNALKDAARRNEDVRGATLYVTLEPCCTTGRTPPCTDAIIGAGIGRVVIGAVDPNPRHDGRGVDILRAAGIEVVCGVESIACARLNECFFHWISSGKPFVFLKLAVTLDGRIATENGDSKWITGSEARRRVQQLRRLCDAIIVGGNTFKLDGPRLTVREPENWERQPQRVIVSNSVTPEEAAEFYPDGRAEVIALPDAEAWQEYMLDLGERRMMAVLIEGGGEVAASALRAGVVDYVEFHIAPKILGGRESRCAVGGESPLAMAEAMQLQDISVDRYGDDIVIGGYLREQ
ncbi:MAG: bifunctional diaminohydroxyphosphoribosylaminopyrimidine deaminase/5-amino-6-(5-phosphoribosylamino)uracil reductase RibD [Lentisphaeria bacterium]|nr:bifunctional diaminohydroxyphosphoribosylaminopyrimidine deaminase/5-amino-6-(5-phosphoribosylamino)uracil reductase RibD [Lentisphaeria bacterium]